MSKNPLMRPLGLLGDIAGRAGRVAAEVMRALPDSKGGEEPKDLQRWRTDLFTLFTTTLGQSVLFYSADQWVQIKLLLDTAGPVAVGTRSEIVPVLSGKGLLLTTDVQYQAYLPKGTRLYYAAENVNRISVTVEPIPWMEQLSMEIRRVGGSVAAAAQAIVAGVRGGPPPIVPVMPKTSRPDRLAELTKIPGPGRMR